MVSSSLVDQQSANIEENGGISLVDQQSANIEENGVIFLGGPAVGQH